MHVNIFKKIIFLFLSPPKWRFLIRNIYLSYRMPIFSSHVNSAYTIEPFMRNELKFISKLYAHHHDGKILAIDIKTLLFLAGKRLCLVVRNTNGDFIGSALYYFNSRDKMDRTIHEGYIGLLPDCQGKGIGTEMRKYALNHFKFCGLNGISSRVSISNNSSFHSNLKLGFDVVESYFDHQQGENRCYMVRWFNNNGIHITG